MLYLQYVNTAEVVVMGCALATFQVDLDSVYQLCHFPLTLEPAPPLNGGNTMAIQGWVMGCLCVFFIHTFFCTCYYQPIPIYSTVLVHEYLKTRRECVYY